MGNLGVAFNQKFVDEVNVNPLEVSKRINRLAQNNSSEPVSETTILKIISCLDLTSLNGDDTPEKIAKLLQRARSPLAGNALKVASVCVYQPFVKQSVAFLSGTEIGVATVAGGFPAGQMEVSVKCADIEKSVQMGATEIDAVINRSNPLTGKWEDLYNEVSLFKKACGTAKLKVILATGELADYEIIAKTSRVCMMAGADFIKTSTGLEKVNATLEAGFVMINAIKEYQKYSGFAVGFKPAGGIKTTQQALQWWQLLHDELGADWANKSLFRIGASSLLDDLLLQLNPR